MSQAAGGVIPGVALAIAIPGPIGAALGAAGQGAGTVIADAIYSAIEKKRKGRRDLVPISRAAVHLATGKMLQDFGHSVVHDGNRVRNAAVEAQQRHGFLGDARGRSLASQPPPATIDLALPKLFGRTHPLRLQTPESRLVEDAARRLRDYQKRELRGPLNILSASINVGINIAMASLRDSYGIEVDIYAQSRMGVDQLQELIAPRKVEYHFGILPEGPVSLTADTRVNSFERLVPLFRELGRTLARSRPPHTRRRRRVFYFADSSSEEHYLVRHHGAPLLEGQAVPYLDDLIRVAKYDLDAHDWIVLWEPLASSLMRASDGHQLLHDVELTPYEILFWLLGRSKLMQSSPEVVRDFVYVLAAEWAYLAANEAVAGNVLANCIDLLESFPMATGSGSPAPDWH